MTTDAAAFNDRIPLHTPYTGIKDARFTFAVLGFWPFDISVGPILGRARDLKL